MVNININNLVELKKEVNNGLKSQKVDVQVTKSYIVEDYCKRSRKLSMAKDYIESHIKGLTVFVTGGGIKKHNVDTDYTEYNPIVITTFKTNDKNHFSKIILDGYMLQEDNYASMIYDSYTDFLVTGGKIEEGHVSTMEICLTDLLYETCLCESGFTSDYNQLMLFKDEKAYTIIEDITTDVQGVIKLNLPDELDESIIVICNDRIILLSDDCFYIDVPEKAVA